MSQSSSTKILISRLSATGDVMQTLPLLHALKTNNPNIAVGWLVEETAAPLLENHPFIDHLHVCPRKTWQQNWYNPKTWQAVVEFIHTIQAQKYTHSLDVQGLFKSAIWPFLASIPNRVGFKNTREFADLLYTQTVPPHDLHNPNVATIDIFRQFAGTIDSQPLPAPRFPIPKPTPQASQKTGRLLTGLDHQKPRIALAPATIWPSKHWIKTHWAELITSLAPKNNLIIIGSPADQPLVEKVLSTVDASVREHVLNLTGQTSLVDLYALFEQMDMVIGPDSAPLHIANAVADNHPQHKPRLIGLFGPTAPGRTGPIGDHHQSLHTTLDCQPCFKRHCPIQTHDCMVQLSPQQVIATVAQQQQAMAEVLAQ